MRALLLAPVPFLLLLPACSGRPGSGPIAAEEVPVVADGEVLPSTISGIKFFDPNENGVFDPLLGDVVIPGWRIELYKDGMLEEFTFTDQDGRYEFTRDQDGSTYLITEVAPGAGFIPHPGAIWLPTTERMGMVTADAFEVDGPDFGNVSFAPLVGAGRSKGFYSNKNGKRVLETCDPDWRHALNALCLRNRDGSIFEVPLDVDFDTAFDALAGFLKSNNGKQKGNGNGNGGTGQGPGSEAYTLSKHLAAAVVNNLCGFMQGTLYIDVEQDGVLVSFAQLVADATLLLCDPAAGDTGPGGSSHELAIAISQCIHEFEDINNTGDLSNPQVVNGITGDPEQFDTPYGEGTEDG